MDGDAIGGSINLVTKILLINALSMLQREVVTTGSAKAQLNLGFTYGDRFFNDRLGMLLSASYQNAPSGSYDTEFMWEQNEDGKVYVSDYQMRQYFVTRERQSYSAAFDFDINENHKLTFKGIFNNRNDWENRYRTNIKDLDENGKGTVRIRPKQVLPIIAMPVWSVSVPWISLWAENTYGGNRVWIGIPVMQKLRKNALMNVILTSN